MKLLIKLAIAALLANAAYRIGSEYLTYIKFRDAIRDAAMFKATTDAELRKKIMDLSDQYDVPLVDEALIIHREERHVVVEGKDAKPIEVVPTYAYPWPFSWTVDAMVSTTYPLVPPKK